MTGFESTSLFGEPIVRDDNSQKILKKSKEPKDVSVTKAIKSKKMSLDERIASITENVYKILGQHKEDTVVIRDKESLVRYFDKAIENGIISIDTETNNSLDPITCKLMGLCLYTPGLKSAYVPINHIDPHTRERLSWQLTESDCKEQLERVIHKDVDVVPMMSIYHNGKFDYEVLKCTCNVELPIDWDTLIGARLLDENESASLKEQYIAHINPEQAKYSIEKLFEKEEYAVFDPDVFALYAATDAMMTYELYLYQVELFKKEENSKVYKLFKEVELPCVKVVAEMELRGVVVDLEYCGRLSTKYHKLLDDMSLEMENELHKYDNKIKAWRLTSVANEHPKKSTGNGEGKSKNEQLTDPINLGSPTQLAIFLYDVLECPVVDKSKPRGTGKDELTAIYSQTKLEFCKMLLEYKKMSKLIEGFLDTLPSMVNEKTGRIHCNYNQIGADTGRFSCSSPNLQQIPSKNKEIRLMFKAQEGYCLVGSDFSQQEPRLMSNYSKDENMITAYKEGKDLYSTIASRVYHNAYEDNLEHYPDGSINEEGKNRRSKMKGLLLGIMYGMGVQSIADIIDGSKEEAQDILDGFFKSFPKVRKWIDETEAFGKKYGYVEDWFGRRRRLPNLLLDPYVVTRIKNKDSSTSDFNPFLGCSNRVFKDTLIEKYKKDCESIRSYRDYDNIKKKAFKEGIDIQANTSLISAATRQCVNARIQGGAATMTKVAMIKLFNDKELNDLDFHMLIGVHDELIGECPKENAEKVADRLTYIMKTCIEDYCVVPFKCDADVTEHWYESEYASSVGKELKTLIKGDVKKNIPPMTKEEAFEKICEIHSESTREYLEKVLN